MTTKTAKTKAPSKSKAKASPRTRKTAVPPAEPKANKSAALRQLLQRPEGATIDEMMNATGWQKHTVRAWLSRGGGSLKAHGPKVVRDAESGRYRQPAE